MKARLLAGVLTLSLATGMVAPALADGAASTRNVVILGAAAGVLITNHNHKVRAKRLEMQGTIRRQTAYRTWFYQKYGYYPTYDQFKKWYYQTYGVDPG